MRARRRGIQVRREQAVVGALFGYPAVGQEDDLVGSSDGSEAVRDHHDRAACHQAFDAFVDGCFVDRIQG